MKRERASIVWSPTWDLKIQQWTRGFINSHKWRAEAIHGEDDLLQDCWLIFHKIKTNYPRIIKPADFLKVYKQSVRNAMHDHSRKVQFKRNCLAEVYDQEASSPLVERIVGEVTNNGLLVAAINECPELKQALELYAEDPERLHVEDWRYSTVVVRRRENRNAKLKRLLDLDHDFDFTGRLKDLLT